MTTESLRDLANVILWFGLIAAACGTAGVNYFRAKLEREREVISKTKEQQSQERATRLQQTIDDLLKGNVEVSKQNQKLLEDIQNYQSDLKARNERIQQLEQAAKAAKRGVLEQYDFNGAKRVQSAGRISVTAGEETVVFQKFLELDKARDARGIIQLGEAQIAKTPEWLTPYFFLGMAYANLGNREKAIQYLEHVVDQAAGDVQYKQAGEILAQLKATK